ncbi:MAG: hypothetical protein KJ571_14360 [Bacteroidetes bacterium]|nr:hypothetical protein [Bacteroidota bacterium]
MKKYLILAIFVLFFLQLNAQIKIKELPPYDLKMIDSSFTEASSTRNLITLRNDWKIFSPDSPENKTDISIPSAFEGAENMIYEREINFTDEQIINNVLELVFLGINYSGEILINNKLIYKHSGGELPFSIELPKDILKFGSPNKLTINLHFNLNSRNTIPFKSGFLAPENYGGITRDIYIRLIPLTNIKKVDVLKTNLNNLPKTDIEFTCSFEKSKNFKKTSTDSDNYSVSAVLVDKNNKLISSNKNLVINFNKNQRANLNFNLSLNDTKLWSPISPDFYKIYIKLYNNEILIDETMKTFSLYEFSNSGEGILLNNQPFSIRGTTYLGSYNRTGNLVSYQQIEKDLTKIKETGFNTVRFSKIIPHPYSLFLCQKLGLLAFIELPSNSIPESFIEGDNFTTRAESFLRVMLNDYSKYSAVAAIGLGSSHISSSEVQINMLKKLSSFIKNNYHYFTYASFLGYPKTEIEDLDLYGIEIYSKSAESLREGLAGSINSLGKSKIFFSEITYPYFKGSKNGYDTPNSIEAQAKFLNDLIGFSKSLEISGYFINSLFDYKGAYSSFYSGYNNNNIYKIGILGKDKDENNIAYKTLKYNLGEGERVTIPIGTKENDSPLLFILFALGLAVLMGIIMNSKRKFREDSSRALMRPYNFYADIRDHRVLSGFHTFFLMFVLAGSHALLQVNILYYLRTNILLEKLILSAGSSMIASLVNYLAWNPTEAFIYLFIFSLLLFVLISLLVKTASLFLKTRVMFSSIYFVVVWAFLPFALLLPVELILYKVLQNGIFNYYIYGFLLVFSLWIFQRLLKGVFVIFDVPAYKVYLFTFMIVVLVLGTKLIYFQLSESTIDYIITSIKQFQLM